MQKNILLLIIFSFLVFSRFSHAAESFLSWKPKYETVDGYKLIKEKEKKDTVSTKLSATKRAPAIVQTTARADDKAKKAKKRIKPTVSVTDLTVEQRELFQLYTHHISKNAIKGLKVETMKLGTNAVPVLTKVMKDSAFPERNRWTATFMLGRIMGKKSAPFIAKFAQHPHWMMRLASLKVLLALGQKEYKGIYAKALKDNALIVRTQALDNIRKMQLTELAPNVWAMLYDKSNYKGKQGKTKRTHIIKDAIELVGELKFEKAKKPMMKMIQNDKYRDVFKELDSSLASLYGKESPSGGVTSKRYYWQRLALKDTIL